MRSHWKKRKPRTSKNLRRHAGRRAYERFGLSTLDVEHIGRAIRERDATVEFYDRQSLNITRWIATVGELKVAVVYNKKLKAVATIMPVDYLRTTVGQRLVEQCAKESE